MGENGDYLTPTDPEPPHDSIVQDFEFQLWHRSDDGRWWRVFSDGSAQDDAPQPWAAVLDEAPLRVIR